VAAAVAICLIPFSIYEVFRPSEVVEPVYLRAVRGLPGNSGSVGRPLMLNLDLSALPRHESLGVELVDKDGHLIWRRSIRARAADALPVKSPALPSGLYYVRAYSPSKALLREYELRIGRNQ
jgi:hypothetical protein